MPHSVPENKPPTVKSRHASQQPRIDHFVFPSLTLPLAIGGDGAGMPTRNGDKRARPQANGDDSDAVWEKVLWRRQPFPDNYVPSSYLAELDSLREYHCPPPLTTQLTPTPAPRPRPRLLPLMLATLPVSQHLAVIALFLAVFYAMLVGDFGAAEVGWSCTALELGAYALWRFGWGSDKAAKTECASASLCACMELTPKQPSSPYPVPSGRSSSHPFCYRCSRQCSGR